MKRGKDEAERKWLIDDAGVLRRLRAHREIAREMIEKAREMRELAIEMRQKSEKDKLRRP